MMRHFFLAINSASDENKNGFNKNKNINNNQIRRGTFQADSLSPLLFCIALIPLTNELNRADCVYQLQGTERKIKSLIVYG
jgi:hypothetical protein